MIVVHSYERATKSATVEREVVIILDAEKSKKLQQYATILQEQAKDAESNGKNEDAIKFYLKLVDVFLILGSEAQDHGMWSQYIRQAEAYQSRIRSLVPQDQTVSLPAPASRVPPPGERPSQGMQKKPIDSSVSIVPDPSQATSPGAGTPKTNAFTKILKPFQKGETPTEQAQSTTSTSQIPFATPAKLNQVTSSTIRPSSGQSPSTAKPISEDRSPIPHELYERSLTENKILQEKLQAATKEKEDYIAILESKNRELEERVAMMVTRQDYDLLRAEFDRMVPKAEYDRVRDELSNSIPVNHYNFLIDRISNMVPREIYLSSEKRALELEARLRHSVPVDVIEDIANEVSFLNVVAEVPPIAGDVPGNEGAETDEDLKVGTVEQQLTAAKSKASPALN